MRRVVWGPGGVHWSHQVHFVNAHHVIGSATKSAVACPRHNPSNAVVLQLSDNGKRRVSGAFQIMGYCGTLQKTLALQVGGLAWGQYPYPVKIIDYGNRKNFAGPIPT